MASTSPDGAADGASICLLIFAKYPHPGHVKTRLIPALGPAGAAALYQEMAEFCLGQVRALGQQGSLTVQVWFAGAEASAFQAWLGDDLAYYPQSGEDLGERLATAFQAAFAQGHSRVMAMGTDCPSLDSRILSEGFQALEHHDLVLGPATDGGYYLIGLQRPWPELFQAITWSTAAVLPQTVTIAERLGLSLAYLPRLTDVDKPEDLEIWQQITRPPLTPLERPFPL